MLCFQNQKGNKGGQGGVITNYFNYLIQHIKFSYIGEACPTKCNDGELARLKKLRRGNFDN